MPLVDGMHHLALLTTDLDRWIAFYRRVFEAQVVMDLREEGLRHVFLDVGSGTLLHAFRVPGVEMPAQDPPMLSRGRLDHIALRAPALEAFRELRRRLVAEGASDGEVIDMGSLLLVTFTDPDGGGHEIVWEKPGMPADTGLLRAEWTRSTGEDLDAS